MKEILTMGDITKDFNRLGITIKETYRGKDYGVCEVNENELKLLCDEPDIEGTWEDGGWRYCEGSNQSVPSDKAIVNRHKLICWRKPDDFDDKENSYIPQYDNLLEYLCYIMGCSQPRNICALTKDLALYNNMTMAELFKKYQG